MQVAFNPRRRRRRNKSKYRRRHRRNPMRAFNGRRRHRRSRRRARNGIAAITGGMKGKLFTAFKPANIAVGGGGYVGQRLFSWATGQLLSYATFLPDAVKSGIGKNVLDLISVGLFSAIVPKIPFINKYSTPLIAGSLIGAWTPIFAQIGSRIAPSVFSEYGDYLTPYNAASALPLGDYLTVGDVNRATPFNGFSAFGCDADGAELELQ